MPSSLIRGRHVVCRTIDDSQAEVINDGAVFQRDGTIVEVGQYHDVVRRYQPDEILGSDDSIVLPGFVNAHHHVGLTPFQLGSLDCPLELSIIKRLGARRVDPYLDTLYSAFEMIESGVTTVQHLHGHMWEPPETWAGTTDQILGAYRDIGMRVCYSAGIVDQNRTIPEEKEFLATLPAELQEQIGGIRGADSLSVEEQLARSFIDVMTKWGQNKDDRIRIQLAPQNLHWCSDGALLAIKECSTRYGVGMHMHLLETAFQKEYARHRSTKTAVGHLHDLGLLGPDMTLGHVVWATEDDIELIAATGTFICTNASSNLRLRSGIVPINHFLQAAVKVAIGIDEAGINDDRDMLQEMRMVLNINRVPGLEPVPTASQVFQMATEYGARTTGFGERIGDLAAGKAADIVIMDWPAIAYPHLDVHVPVVDAVLYRGRVAAVNTVIVGGEPIYRDRQFTRLNREAVLAELAKVLEGPPSNQEVQRGRLAAALVPRVRNYLDGWAESERKPFYEVNSRN